MLGPAHTSLPGFGGAVKGTADVVDAGAQATQGGVPRRVGRETFRNEGVNACFEERAKLVVGVGMDRVGRSKREAKEPSDSWPEVAAHRQAFLADSTAVSASK